MHGEDGAFERGAGKGRPASIALSAVLARAGGHGRGEGGRREKEGKKRKIKRKREREREKERERERKRAPAKFAAADAGPVSHARAATVTHAERGEKGRWNGDWIRVSGQRFDGKGFGGFGELSDELKF